jgi:hypothetical protein
MACLVVADHPGCPSDLRARLSGLASGAVFLTLPWWQDSSLSRQARIGALSETEQRSSAAHAARLMHLLHEALRATGTSELQWQYLRQVLETHAVVPLTEAVALVAGAAQRVRAQEIIALVDWATRDYWAGQARAESGAAAAARALGIGMRRYYLWRGRALPSAAGLVAGLLTRLRPVALGWQARLRHRRLAKAVLRPPWPAALAEEAEVLLLTAGPVTQALALRLAAALGEEGLRCVLAADPLAPAGPQRELFTPLGAWAGAEGYGRLRSAAQAGCVRRRFLRLISTLRPYLDRSELHALAPRLLSLELRERPLLAWLEADAQAVMEKLRPRVIVAFHFLPRLATPYLVAGRAAGARTVCCQHGLIGFLDYASPWFDRFLVFNRYTAGLVAAQAPQAEVSVVGNPFLDELVGQQPAPLRPPEAGARPVVLIATQPTDPPQADQQPGWWFACLAQACARLGAFAEVKLHPQQRLEREGAMYKRALSAAGAKGKVIGHGQAALASLIAGCDVFVSQFSSTLLAALVLSKPALFVELAAPDSLAALTGHSRPPFYPFADFGAALRVTQAEEIEPALRQALANPNRLCPTEFAYRHLEPLDGRAVERMAAALAAEARHPPA